MADTVWGTSGFLSISGHGIDPELTAELDGDVTDQTHSRVKASPPDAEKVNMQRAAMNIVTEDFSSIVRAPAPGASMDAIMEFSNTYDGYGVHRSLERMSIVAKRVWDARAAGTLADCELDDLRAALFMTQRGWRSFGKCPEPDVGVEWELVEAINEASDGLVRDDRLTPR